jgi:hypothetical protein
LTGVKRWLVTPFQAVGRRRPGRAVSGFSVPGTTPSSMLIEVEMRNCANVFVYEPVAGQQMLLT